MGKRNKVFTTSNPTLTTGV